MSPEQGTRNVSSLNGQLVYAGHASAAAGGREREDDFVAALAELEPSAWRRLSEEHYRRVRHDACVRTGSTSDADEVAANVFVAAVKGIRGFRHRDVPIAAWLLGIAPRGVVTTLGYDVLNRLKSKTYSTSAPAVSFQYDRQTTDGPCPGAQAGVGHVTKMSDGAGAQWPCYDLRGRETQTSRTVGTSTYNVLRTYDALADVTGLTYPDGEQVTYSYGADTGTLGSVSSSLAGPSLVSQAYVTPWLAPGGLLLGDGKTATRYTYDYRERVVGVQTGTTLSPASAQQLALTYDDASNVTAVTDKTTGEADAYSYDQLNRLTGITVNGVTGAAYTYDSVGDLKTKQEGGTTLNPMLYGTDPFLSGSGVPAHALGATTIAGLPGWSSLYLAYDANGNLCATATSFGSGCAPTTGTLYTYDAENRLTSRTDAAGGSDTYVYDGRGTLLKRTLRDGSYTVYIGGVYEEAHSSTGGVTGVTKYYQAFGRNVAVRTSAGLYYLLADHLGSTVGLLDTSGNVVLNSKTTYWPYGAVRSTSSITQTDRLFTGQQQEPPASDVLGLYDFKARFYSTLTGRFVSADTVGGLNRYAYAGNSPAVFNDPTGHCITFAGVTISSCTAQDQLNWLQCALSCGDNWLGAIARYGIQQQSYWENVAESFLKSDRNEFLAPIISAISAKATLSTFEAIPQLGFNFLAGAFGVRTAFFKASLHDLVFGSNMMRSLPDDDIKGASPWWDPIFWQLELLHQLSRSEWHRLNGFSHILADLTQRVARGSLYPNKENWSDWQRNVALADQKFGVYPARRQPDSTDVSGCFADGTCLAQVSGSNFVLPNEPQYNPLDMYLP